MKKYFVLLIALSSFSVFAQSYPDTRTNEIHTDIYLNVGNCQVENQTSNGYMPIVTSLKATVSRSTITVQKNRTCTKTEWFSKSCTPWAEASRSTPVTAI